MFIVRKSLIAVNILKSVKNNLNKFVVKFCGSNNMNTDIVWIDLEMTGLDVDKDHIIEVGCLITNANLEIVSENFHTIIHQPDEIINKMDDWCTKTHRISGLTDAVKQSYVTTDVAEDQLLNFIKKYVKNEKTCPMAGNSIYMDRLFIRKLMPKVDNYLHYRVIDVSSIKELANRWYPSIKQNKFHKKLSHRAVDDINASIEELKYYRKNIFKNEQ